MVMESDSSAVGPSVTAQNIIHHPNNTTGPTIITNGLGATACQTGYYPSPAPSTTETESSGSVMAQQQQIQQQRRGLIDVNGGPPENTGFPEYKH
jgi:hypothetical protein